MALRNEKHNIGNLLLDLSNQNYPSALLEILLCDDHSDDNTIKNIDTFISRKDKNNHEIKVIASTVNDPTGKKATIERGIHFSSGELIITTDADCRMSANWVKSFVSVYVKTNASMITGFVEIFPAKKILDRLQALEFLSLSGTGAASVISKKPLMCNGANLAFTRRAFLNAGGYSYGKNSASGDDTFLMLKIASEKSANVVFNKDPDGIVKTGPVLDLSGFISQRIRWASKVKTYNETYIKITGFLVLMTNLCLITSFIFTIPGWFSWKILVLLWVLKAIPDFIFLANMSAFAKQRQLLLLFLPASLIYPFYSLAGLLPAFVQTGYMWKGRKLK